MKILVIVESPAKVKKISDILNADGGVNGNSYIVAATVGHILDLNKEKTIGVDLENGYAPDYVENSKKKDVITNLKKLHRNCDRVWIASDLDQEGEFIGWSICNILGLNYQTTPRIIFNEITKTAILRACSDLKRLSDDLLAAQRTRRISDRLIGFLISQAARSVNNELTVGRVQTIMVKLVVAREQEMENFVKTLAFQTTGDFLSSGGSDGGLISGKLAQSFSDIKLVRSFLEKCRSGSFVVGDVSERIASKNPPPPLITSTLQSLVSSRVGIPPKAVLDIAQKLYQMGVISYPRTDCPRLPEEKIAEIEKLVKGKYGNQYYQRRQFQSKDASAQEAHACIYPTNLKVRNLEDDDGDCMFSASERRVYDYIWLYAVSSQMKPSETQVTKARINVEFEDGGLKKVSKEYFTAEHQKLIFEGYLKVWGKVAVQGDESDEEGSDDDQNVDYTKNLAILKLKKGDVVFGQLVESTQKPTQGPSPYTESGLLTQMKKMGIGRPSTYGTILSDVQGQRANENGVTKKPFIYKGNKPGEKVKIQILGVKGDKKGVMGQILESSKEIKMNAYKNRLFSTELGRAIQKFVDDNFTTTFDYEFTARLEREMEKIESGESNWVEVVDEIYQDFAPSLSKFPSGWGGGFKAKPKRRLSGDYNGQPVYAYLAKYGPVIQVGEDRLAQMTPDELAKLGRKKIDRGCRFVALPKEYNIEKVTLDGVRHLLDFPIRLGELSDGRPAILKKSKYGLYIDTDGAQGRKPGRKRTYQCSPEMFEDYDDEEEMDQQIHKISLDLVINAVEESEKPKDVLRQIKDIQIVEGKYGPYFIYNNKLVGIPKHQKVELITYQECLDLYKFKLTGGSFRGRGGSTSRGGRGSTSRGGSSNRGGSTSRGTKLTLKKK